MDISTWKTALEVYTKFKQKHGREIGRKKLQSILDVPEHEARSILWAIKHKHIISMQAVEYDTPKKDLELIIADIHIPYEDRIALQTLFNWLDTNDIKPTIITILGDLLDFYKISRFSKDPTRKNVAVEIELGKQFLIDLRNRFPDARIIFYSGNHECVSWDTEILTDNGFKKAVAITKDDIIGQFDINTGEITFTKPIAVSQYTVDRYAEIITNQGHEKVSLNHRLVIDNKFIEVKDILHNYETFTQTQQRFAGFYKRDIHLDMSPAYLKLLTWVIMDGTWVISSGRKMRIQFKLSKRRKIKTLTSLLHELDIPYTIQPATISGGNKLQPYMIRIYGEYARQIIRVLDYKKEFPLEWAYKLNEEQTRAIIDTIKNTDGCEHFNHIAWSSISKHNMDTLQIACILNNIPFKYTQKNYNKGFATKRDHIYYASIYDKGVFGSHFKIQLHTAPLHVVAITTPKGTLITRYNGKVNFTGNSRLQKYIWDNAPQLTELVRNLLPEKLGLKELNIEFHETPFRIGKLWHLHGHERGRGGYNAEYITNVMWKYIHDNFIVAHWHRRQEKIFKSISGKTYYGGVVGCLCQDMDYAILNNWTKGFALVYYDTNGFFNVKLYDIIDGYVL